MNIFLKITYKVFSFLSSVIKPSKVIVFCSYPAFTDNAFAVYQYIIEKKIFPEYKLVWIVLNPRDARKENIPYEIQSGNSIVFSNKSILALFYYLIARYVFITHGLYSNLKIERPNTIINLFHGMPLKRIGLMDNKGPTYMDNSQILIATNKFFQNIMAESFGKKIDNVLVVGQPRNDLMFQKTDFYEKNNIDRSKYRLIGIWLPTYRSSTFGDIRIDGCYEKGKISFLAQENLYELDSFLVREKILVIVKLHPMDKLQDYDFTLFSNLLIVKQKEFNSQLYPLLGSTDFLLTDFSSVWIDYDILDRPIGFVMNDIEAYKNSRGLTLENLDKELPGQLISNMNSLTEFLLHPGKYKINTGHKFNRYKDNKASERLISWLRNLS